MIVQTQNGCIILTDEIVDLIGVPVEIGFQENLFYMKSDKFEFTIQDADYDPGKDYALVKERGEKEKAINVVKALLPMCRTDSVELNRPEWRCLKIMNKALSLFVGYDPKTNSREAPDLSDRYLTKTSSDNPRILFHIPSSFSCTIPHA